MRTGGNEMRTSITEFAEAMEAKLATLDDEKGPRGWLYDESTVEWLLDRLQDEVNEARKSFRECDAKGVCEEVVDVANFAMMIKDRIEQ